MAAGPSGPQLFRKVKLRARSVFRPENGPLHNSEIAVKKVQASKVVYCELIGEGESTELI